MMGKTCKDKANIRLTKVSNKPEAQNRNLAINAFGWERKCVIVYRKSRKEAKVPWINLMLIESENLALLLHKKSKSFASRSDQKEQCKTLLHDMFDWFFKSEPTREPQKILLSFEMSALYSSLVSLPA